jgi:S1-C subfamily serine protease/tetratricopeptide (TPR) repeat protein
MFCAAVGLTVLPPSAPAIAEKLGLGLWLDRSGPVEIVNPRRFVYDVQVSGQTVFSADTVNSIQLIGTLPNSDAPKLLFLRVGNGGASCAGEIRILDLSGPSPKVSPAFGECGGVDGYIGLDQIVLSSSTDDGPVSWSYASGSLSKVERLTPENHVRLGTAAYVAGDFSTALRHLWGLSDSRFAEAPYYLGLMAHIGKGVQQNYGEAIEFYRRAVDLEYPPAFFRLGVMYANGRGTAKDMVEAVKWYRKAAERGDGSGQYNLGLNLLTGIGTKKDLREAFFWLLLASERQSDPKDREVVNKSLAATEAKLDSVTAAAVKRDVETWRPSGPTTWANASALRVWLGKNPFEKIRGITLFEVPEVNVRLRSLMGLDAFRDMSKLYVSGGAIEQDGYIVAGGCRPHACPDEQMTVAISLSDYSIFACAHVNASGVHPGKALWAATNRSQINVPEGCPETSDMLVKARAVFASSIAASLPSPASPAKRPDAFPVTPSRPEPPVSDTGLSATGSGFSVNLAGDIVTNQHVVDGCRTLRLRRGQATAPARLIAEDRGNDLAVVQGFLEGVTPLLFRDGRSIRPADQVVAVGFPLASILGSAPQVTTGTVTSLSGIKDDTRYLQITAPIQPGSSGGPLVDLSGHVVGVIVATVNTLAVASATGSIPQNVNFAIKASAAREFLDAKVVEQTGAPSTERLDPADVGETTSSLDYS